MILREINDTNGERLCMKKEDKKVEKQSRKRYMVSGSLCPSNFMKVESHVSLGSGLVGDDDHYKGERGSQIWLQRQPRGPPWELGGPCKEPGKPRLGQQGPPKASGRAGREQGE